MINLVRTKVIRIKRELRDQSVKRVNEDDIQRIKEYFYNENLRMYALFSI